MPVSKFKSGNSFRNSNKGLRDPDSFNLASSNPLLVYKAVSGQMSNRVEESVALRLRAIISFKMRSNSVPPIFR